MARVRSGQAPAWPCLLAGVSVEVSGVKRDFACKFTRHFSPVLVARRSQSRLRLEGRTRTLSGPPPDLSPVTTWPDSRSCQPAGNDEGTQLNMSGCQGGCVCHVPLSNLAFSLVPVG